MALAIIANKKHINKNLLLLLALENRGSFVCKFKRIADRESAPEFGV